MSSERCVKQTIDLESIDKQTATINSDYKSEFIVAIPVEQGYSWPEDINCRFSSDKPVTDLGINIFI